MLATIEIEQLLTGQLIDGIGGERTQRRIFSNRTPLTRLSIHSRTRSKYRAPHRIRTHGLANIQGADEVAAMSTQWVIDRRLDRCDRSQVSNGLAPAHGLGDLIGISDITNQQFQTRMRSRQIYQPPSREVIEHTHGVATIKQRNNEVRANKAGSPRYEDWSITHRRSPLTMTTVRFSQRISRWKA